MCKQASKQMVLAFTAGRLYGNRMALQGRVLQGACILDLDTTYRHVD